MPINTLVFSFGVTCEKRYPEVTNYEASEGFYSPWRLLIRSGITETIRPNPNSRGECILELGYMLMRFTDA